MSVNVKVTDAKTRQTATVFENGSILNREDPKPPFGGRQRMRIFRQFLTDDGTSSGDNDMRVDGSTTPVEFWIGADQEDDIYLKRLSFVVADASASLNNFGNLTPLVNGCELEYEDEKGVSTIHEALQTNWDFIRLCSGNPAFGQTTNAFRASNVSGNAEGYIPVLDLVDTFGFRWGVKLAAGSEQRMLLRVNDLISSILMDEFNVIAYGFTRSPD